MTCCFFGHKDTISSPELKDRLEGAIEDLITKQGVTEFLVGNQGQFDAMALAALRKLKKKYPGIYYHVVLAYMPTEKEEYPQCEYGETMFPEGLETVHPRFAISRRNQWMVNKSDFVICYITHSWGGAAKYVEMATKSGKNVIHLQEKH